MTTVLCQIGFTADAISVCCINEVLSSRFKILITVCDSNILLVWNTCSIIHSHQISPWAKNKMVMSDMIRWTVREVFPHSWLYASDNFLFMRHWPRSNKDLSPFTARKDMALWYFLMYNVDYFWKHLIRFPHSAWTDVRDHAKWNFVFCNLGLSYKNSPFPTWEKNYRPTKFPWQGRVTYVFHSEFVLFFKTSL